MSANPFDQACRYLARLDPPGLFAWLLRLPLDAFTFERWLDTRRISYPGDPERTCDTVAFLRDQTRHGIPWAVIVEFQIAPDALMFGRFLVYQGLLWLEIKPSPERGDRFELGAVVVNLTGIGRGGRDMHWPEASLRTALENPDRNLAEKRAAEVLAGIAAGQITRAVLGWIPLMQGGAEEAIIQQWIEVASTENDAARRGDHASLALVFAEAAGCADAWRKALEGWNVIQSRQVLEWQAAALGESLVEQLEARFGRLPEDAAATIRAARDVAQLRRWAVLAVKVDSLERFRQDAKV